MFSAFVLKFLFHMNLEMTTPKNIFIYFIQRTGITLHVKVYFFHMLHP